MNLFYALIPIGAVATIYLIRKIREFQWGWVRQTYSLEGKVFIITGANTGLGFETTKALVARKATVIMACRCSQKANVAVNEIRKVISMGQIIVMDLDLKSFDSIKRFANAIIKEHPNFNCLINNAGLATTTNEMTDDGYEIHFGVNHLGHFLLTHLLKECIKANNSRIVVVSSLMHQRGHIDFEHLGKMNDSVRLTSRTNAYYNNSKLANFYFARELYKKGFDVHVLCPGLCNTDFFRNYNPKWYHYILFSPIVWLMLRSPKQGAQNIIYCATDNINTLQINPSTGYFVRNLKQTKSKFQFNDTISEKLWEDSMNLCLMMTHSQNTEQKTERLISKDEFGRGECRQSINNQIYLDYYDEYEHIDVDSIEYLLENILYEYDEDDNNNINTTTTSKVVNDISTSATNKNIELNEYTILKDLFNSKYSIYCKCCISTADNTNSCCSNNKMCMHGGNYKIFYPHSTNYCDTAADDDKADNNNNNDKELILNTNRISMDLIYECTTLCECKRIINMCQNRLVQFGPRKYLKIMSVSHLYINTLNDNRKQQWGLFTLKSIPLGGFICEYIGEILTKTEAKKRHQLNKIQNKMNYIICLNEYSMESSTLTNNNTNSNNKQSSSPQQRNVFQQHKSICTSQTFIDPMYKGNIGRYLNHSCDPNCNILSIRTDGPLPKLGIFAKRNILPMEELCFDYGDNINTIGNFILNNTDTCNKKGDDDNDDDDDADRKLCYCRSNNCRKYLPNYCY